jgi:hypothetical protein
MPMKYEHSSSTTVESLLAAAVSSASRHKRSAFEMDSESSH